MLTSKDYQAILKGLNESLRDNGESELSESYGLLIVTLVVLVMTRLGIVK